MTKVSITKKIKENISADTIGKNKAGNYIFRKGYFYHHKQTAENFANRIKSEVEQLGLKAVIIRVDDVWKPFRGGASVAQSSHFLAEIQITQ